MLRVAGRVARDHSGLPGLWQRPCAVETWCRICGSLPSVQRTLVCYGRPRGKLRSDNTRTSPRRKAAGLPVTRVSAATHSVLPPPGLSVLLEPKTCRKILPGSLVAGHFVSRGGRGSAIGRFGRLDARWSRRIGCARIRHAMRPRGGGRLRNVHGGVFR